jgi:hypothetical protein
MPKTRPTKRAPDKWESARFRSIFLALSFFYISNSFHARPLAGNANRWAGVCKVMSEQGISTHLRFKRKQIAVKKWFWDID